MARPVGSKNVRAMNAQIAICKFLDRSSQPVIDYLDRMLKEDPDKGFEAFLKLLDYGVPKQARVENVHEGGAEFDITARIVNEFAKKQDEKG